LYPFVYQAIYLAIMGTLAMKYASETWLHDLETRILVNPKSFFIFAVEKACELLSGYSPQGGCG